MTPLRRLIAVLLTTAVAAAPASPALAQDNAAVAVNTKDDSTVFKLAFHIARTMQPVVDNQNAAVAYASCTDCRTVAIAIQVVLVMGDPNVITPENVAIAINDGCTACETLAAAYQFVLGNGDLVRLTSEGRKQINDIRKALRELGDEDLPFEELVTRLNELTGQLRQVLKTELVPVAAKRQNDGEQDQSSEQPAATPEAGATPDASATPEPSETPAAEPSATPAATTPPAEPTASATPAATP